MSSQQPAALAAERVPSWTNFAILCLLFTPAVMAVITPFIPPPPADMGPPEGESSSAGLWILCLGCVAATLPLAARLRTAPHLATAIVVVARLLSLGRPLGWMALGGIVLAWVGRRACTREGNVADLPRWVLQGYRRLLRGDRWAVLRVLVGLALFGGGIFFMIRTGNAIKDVVPLSRPVAKFLAIPAFLGAFLAGSGLAFTEVPEPE